MFTHRRMIYSFVWVFRTVQSVLKSSRTEILHSINMKLLTLNLFWIVLTSYYIFFFFLPELYHTFAVCRCRLPAAMWRFSPFIWIHFNWRWELLPALCIRTTKTRSSFTRQFILFPDKQHFDYPTLAIQTFRRCFFIVVPIDLYYGWWINFQRAKNEYLIWIRCICIWFSKRNHQAKNMQENAKALF